MNPKPGKIAPRDPVPRSDEVHQYLSDNPDFLTAHPDLLTVLTPPTHRRGEGVLDMQRYMIDRLQKQVSALRSERGELIAASRGNKTSQDRVHSAALALLEARTLEHLIEVVTTDLANLLDVDVVTFCVESESDSVAARGTGADGVFAVPAGRVDELLGEDRNIVFRGNEGADPGVFAAAAPLVRSAALVRLRINGASPPAVLALGSRDDERFHPGRGPEPLCFLGCVVARCLREWLDLPPS